MDAHTNPLRLVQRLHIYRIALIVAHAACAAAYVLTYYYFQKRAAPTYFTRISSSFAVTFDIAWLSSPFALAGALSVPRVTPRHLDFWAVIVTLIIGTAVACLYISGSPARSLDVGDMFLCALLLATSLVGAARLFLYRSWAR